MNNTIWKGILLHFLWVCVLILPLWGKPIGKEWLPVTPEELQLKDCPGIPGASAVCLYREHYFNSIEFETCIYRRIKVLTPEGRKYGNVEIRYVENVLEIKDLMVRSIKGDGTIIPFSGQFLDKIAIGKRDAKIMIRTFSIPNLDVGDIIEYRYSIKFDTLGSAYVNLRDLKDILTEDDSSSGDISTYEGAYESKGMYSLSAYMWNVDDDELYTMKAKFLFMPYSMEAMWDMFGYPLRCIWVYQKLNGAVPKVNSDREIELEITNVPPFEKEIFMRPGYSENMLVRFFYYNRDITNLEVFWAHEIEAWRKSVNKFIGNIRDYSELAYSISSNTGNTLEKAKKIYEWVQKLKNLSYEPNLTDKTWKEKKYKDNDKVSHVIKHNYGFRSDITRTFVALARAAGLDAQIVRVSRRDNGIFNKNIPDFYGQFDSEIALLIIDGKEIFLDPATPFCPFGTLYWPRTNTTSVREIKSNSEFFVSPSIPYDSGISRKELNLSMDAEGNLKGKATLIFYGQQAIEWKLDSISLDEAGRKKEFEEYLSGFLPQGSMVTLVEIKNIDNTDPQLSVIYDINIPNLATVIGKKILFPLKIFGKEGTNPFNKKDRKYPVYFSYPFQEIDDINIGLPPSFKIESLPEPGMVEGGFASFTIKSEITGNNTIHIRRDLQMKSFYFDLNQYQVLKNFYDMIARKESQQLVLTRSTDENGK